MVSIALSRIFTGLIAAALLFGFVFPLQAKDFIKGERPQQRGYSQAVIAEGGKIVWLAGQLAVVDELGKVPCRRSRRASASDLQRHECHA